MTSIGGTRLGQCILRIGTLTLGSRHCCYKQSPDIPALMVAPNVHLIPYRQLSVVAGRKKIKPSPIDLQDFSHAIKIAKSSRHLRRFITDTDLTKTVLKCLQPWDQRAAGPIILECNPGPGIFTKTLLDAGARVVALESNTDFIPSLQVLQNNLDGKLKVVHCDFFKLDPLGEGSMQPPAMYSSTLFDLLGISEAQWTADVPFQVFGIFSQRNESKILWKHIYNIYERRSIYRYGRIELNVFISEKQYMKLTSQPGDMRNYQALSALYQAAYDIHLLHMEPWSSFLTPSRFKGPAIPKSVVVPNDHLCLVRMTPKRNLFTDCLTAANGNSFIAMVKQCLGKRRAKLIDRLKNLHTVWQASESICMNCRL
ncbi:hypothetical protein GDO86_009533 [Hymenochirus boettgeri]|uniref:rRNA adenine N(6)-methyltransferase n=1 Tax=Hymenochirus boettgeri TaxID=247094 RepID=A0A8T2JM16_9PIPI|nr:hypothetical protein GDO86_009533 [Hymenochirus boettgeri]